LSSTVTTPHAPGYYEGNVILPRAEPRTLSVNSDSLSTFSTTSSNSDYVEEAETSLLWLETETSLLRLEVEAQVQRQFQLVTEATVYLETMKKSLPQTEVPAHQEMTRGRQAQVQSVTVN